MFFGLMNSLATFQTMMNDIFCDMIAEGVVCVYLDDILIFTKTLLEHQTITQRVLECLQEYNLCLKPEKCEFECTQIEYLGVIISEGMVEMDPVKVSGVLEWQEPQNKREVQSFVGFQISTDGSSRISLTMRVPSSTSLRKMSDGVGESRSRPLSIN